MDGASRWQLFRHVIFPLLAPVTTIVIVISIIDSLRAFDLVAIMTRGGQSTQVLANFMYMEAFNNYRMGYGARDGGGAVRHQPGVYRASTFPAWSKTRWSIRRRYDDPICNHAAQPEP